MHDQPVADFSLPATGGLTFRLRDARGVERSTFALDRNGMLKREWRAVKLSDHANQVLEFIQTLT